MPPIRHHAPSRWFPPPRSGRLRGPERAGQTGTAAPRTSAPLLPGNAKGSVCRWRFSYNRRSGLGNDREILKRFRIGAASRQDATILVETANGAIVAKSRQLRLVTTHGFHLLRQDACDILQNGRFLDRSPDLVPQYSWSKPRNSTGGLAQNSEGGLMIRVRVRRVGQVNDLRPFPAQEHGERFRERS